MKTDAKILLIVTALIVGVSAPQTFGSVSVSAAVRINAVSDFHEPLAPHGSWVEVRSYGRCWRPAGIAVGWRPYSSGSWVWTDYGWYWESDEPWGWACYHYGNWYHDSGFGWVWVPGIQWSSAWVSWRTGGGYWGWAPLPPRGVVVRSHNYVFVESRHFHQRIRPNTVIVNNTTVINRTTEIKNTRREVKVNDPQIAPAAKVVVNEGPKREDVEKATGNRVREMAARDIPRPRRNDQKRNLENVTPAKPLQSQNPTPPNKPVPPDKPIPPEKPTPPGKPVPPEKPTPPDRPTPPDKPEPAPPNPVPPEKPVPPGPPVPPEKPAPLPRQDPPNLDKPSPEKPAKPSQPSKPRQRDPKSDRNKDKSPK